MAQHSKLKLLPSLNTVVCTEPLIVKTALVAGAGSGHEPSFHGFVGKGGLAASIAGQVFASPSTGQVLKVLELLSRTYDEILCLVNNYTGDRLNFGLAIEQAKLKGIKCKLFCFGDDVAFQNNMKTGKRGLAGVAFLVKCLGAMCQENVSLDALCETAAYVASRIATISVSLSSCDVPGSGCSFILAPHELEVGLGIHGEAGVFRTSKLLTSRETVSLMVDSLLNEKKSPLRLNDTDRDVALLVNNTGGMSLFELNIIVRDTVQELNDRRVNVKRIHVGTLCSSFSMIGVSISLMQLDDVLLKLIDCECSTPIFNSYQSFTPLNSDSCIVNVTDTANTVEDTPFLEMPGVCRSSWTKMLTAAANAVISIEQSLNELDKVGGDGDCGLTCRTGAETLLSRLTVDAHPSLLSLVAVSDSMGGTSGAIYSLLFTSLHSSILALHEKMSTQQIESMSCAQVASFWCSALDNAIGIISKYSWAERGDRTMLDTLFFVKDALQRVQPDESAETIVTSVVDAAIRGSLATSTMPCRAGRASYVNCEAVVNSPDPGAVAVAEWVKAMAQSLGYTVTQQSSL